MGAFDHSIGPLGVGEGFRFTFAWKDKDGNFRRFYAEGYESPEIAKSQAIENAKLLGYEPPQWWQFWR